MILNEVMRDLAFGGWAGWGGWVILKCPKRPPQWVSLGHIISGWVYRLVMDLYLVVSPVEGGYGGNPFNWS